MVAEFCMSTIPEEIPQIEPNRSINDYVILRTIRFILDFETENNLSIYELSNDQYNFLEDDSDDEYKESVELEDMSIIKIIYRLLFNCTMLISISILFLLYFYFFD